MGDIRGGLDADQCRVALHRVALLHSSFLALRELEPATAHRLTEILRANEREFASDPLILDFREGYLKGLGKKNRMGYVETELVYP